MSNCTCDYPEIKYATWTGHSPTCPIEERARHYPEQRFQRIKKPPGVPRFLRKYLKE